MKLLVVLLLAAVEFSAAQSERASAVTSNLYSTLRNIAFPEPQGSGTSSQIDGRFLLMMPGKVLNYFDFYPGRGYTRFTQVNAN